MKAQRSDAAALNAICNEGLSHHQAGRLDEARQRYQRVLAAEPRHFDALHFLGVYCVQTGQLETAVELIRQAIAIRGDVPGAYGNLANALNSLRRHEEALEACNRAITLSPNFPEAHGNRAQALHQLGRHEEALAGYERVAALKPTAQAHYNCATLLRELGRLDEALASYDRAIALKADYPEAHRSRGVVLCELGRHSAGLESYDRALALRPGYAEALCSRGVALRALGRLNDALASQDLAIKHRPDYAEAYVGRGNVLTDLARHEEALASLQHAAALTPDYADAFNGQVGPLRELQRPQEALAAAERALALKPDHVDGHVNRGVALYDLRRLEETLLSYDEALALNPDHAEAHCNRGVTLYELRRLDEALGSYDKALALKPEFADAHHNQAMCRLALGQYAQGWAQYEWRWRTQQIGPRRYDSIAPLWLGGEPLHGRKIFVHWEQGLGDTLQFCRYARDVAALGAHVVLEVQPGLERLLASLEGVAEIVTGGVSLPSVDFQIPLMSLPLALGSEPEAGRPYLRAPHDEMAAWARRLPGTQALRIGLCWAGGHRPGDLVCNAIDRRRSLPLPAFASLAAVPGLEIYSLQKGPPAAELAHARERGWNGPEIIDLTAELGDFAATAALVANLDLVVTCDTAVAHLAGALGKPVWILDRFDSCWRWLQGRDDSPWYPTVRLFRQTAPGDWGGVVQRIVQELVA